MSVVVFLDETGDHSLEKADEDFPFFAVCLVACETDTYVRRIVPDFYELKYRTVGHEGLILHSRDIRKCQRGFEFLNDDALRARFYDGVSAAMAGSDYRLICTVIRKQEHKEQYGLWAEDLYDLALTFGLERLLPVLEALQQKDVTVIAEARGKNEDAQLRVSFERVVEYGTSYVDRRRFARVRFRLVFLEKKSNVIGTQMADLAAYPIVRHVMDPSRPNPAFEVVRPKLYTGPGMVRGLKVFPQ